MRYCVRARPVRGLAGRSSRSPDPKVTSSRTVLKTPRTSEYEKAKAAGDKKRIEEFEAQGEMMHKQAFSTWPVDNILERIKGEIPEIAKQADVDVIISKWDLTYQRSGIELVDVTPLLVKLLVDDEKSLEDALKIRKMRPIPREQLMDPNE